MTLNPDKLVPFVMTTELGESVTGFFLSGEESLVGYAARGACILNMHGEVLEKYDIDDITIFPYHAVRRVTMMLSHADSKKN